MVNRINKKGAVEMSLNLIIMLVIGLTVMGLIISFVTGFLGDAKDGIQIGEDDKVKLEQTKRLDGNFAFLSSTLKFTKGKDEEKKLYFKARNTKTTSVTVHSGGKLESSGQFFTYSATAGSLGASPNTISVYTPPVILSGSEIGSFPLNVIISDTTPVGTYFLKFSLSPTGVMTEMLSEVVTIEVN